MKYYIIQTEAQCQTTDFNIVKVDAAREAKFLEGLKGNVIVVVVGSSLMDAILKFENACRGNES